MKDNSTTYRPWLMVTWNGYWGKGETPEEAAKNCHLTGKWQGGQLAKASKEFIDGELFCGDFGGVSWNWQDKWWKRDDFRGELEARLQESIIKYQGEFRFRKGKIEFRTTVE